MSRSRVYILGCGGHGRVILDVLRSTGTEIGDMRFVDDRRALWGSAVDGVIVAGGIDVLEPNAPVYIGVGDNIARHNLYLRLHEFGCSFPRLVSPHAVVSSRARIDDGAVVFHRAVVQTGALVERAAVINTGAIVEHDCVVGPFAQLAPAVTLSGSVRVGEGTLLGTGSSVNRNCTLGSWCLIAPGIAVLGDVPTGSVYKPGAETIRVEPNYRLGNIDTPQTDRAPSHFAPSATDPASPADARYSQETRDTTPGPPNTRKHRPQSTS